MGFAVFVAVTVFGEIFVCFVDIVSAALGHLVIKEFVEFVDEEIQAMIIFITHFIMIASRCPFSCQIGVVVGGIEFITISGRGGRGMNGFDFVDFCTRFLIFVRFFINGEPVCIDFGWNLYPVAAAPEAEKANLQKQKPRRSAPVNENPQVHCNLYNGMVDAWTILPIKGVIWYQGCSNAGNPHYYPLHKALIADWRAKWNNPTMPFLIVQLASFGGPQDWQNAPCEDAAYALTRDIQAKVASEDPNVGLACAIDIGEHRNIHPANKQEVGRRLALQAESIAYGKKIVDGGPMLDKTVVEGNTIRVSYKNAPNGLKTSDGQPPRCFAIA